MAAKAPAKGKKGQSKDFDNSNRGALFFNDKDGNDARPDLTGTLKIKAEDFTVDEEGLLVVRIAAWGKNSEKVGDYYSIAASPVQEK